MAEHLLSKKKGEKKTISRFYRHQEERTVNSVAGVVWAESAGKSKVTILLEDENRTGETKEMGGKIVFLLLVLLLLFGMEFRLLHLLLLYHMYVIRGKAPILRKISSLSVVRPKVVFIYLFSKGEANVWC